MAEQRIIKIFIDDGSLEKTMEKDRKLVEKLDRQLANLKEGTKQWNQVTAQREAVLARITQAEAQMAGKVGPSLQMLRAKQRELNRELSQMPAELRAASAAAAQLKKIEAELQKVKNEARETGGVLSRMKTGMSNAANGFNKYLGIVTAFVGAMTGIAMGFVQQIKKAAELSDAYADVAKTTGLSVTQVKELSRELGKIDTRSSRAELLKLASEAGKLGITGQKDITSFVNAADKINVALGEDLGQDAIVNLGKINELMGTNAQFGYGEAMLKTGSAINALGANSMAAEGFLVEMSKRLGGVGLQSKMSIPEILGLSSTVDNLGMQAEMSGTAIQNVLLDMFQDTPKFAKMAGMGLTEFSELMRSNVNEAFIKVLEGVKGNNTGMKELSGNVAQLGIDGARGASVIMALAGKTDFLRQQQVLANEEYNKGTSILDEFNTKNENAAADLEKLSKNINASLSRTFSPEVVSGMVDATNRFLGYETAADQATDALNKQAREVASLDKDATPLINRYEELTAKTEKSAEEQEEIRVIIEKLREQIPFTAFEFDKYGNAISMSTEKSKEFIQQQKEILQVKSKESFEANRDAAIEYAEVLEMLLMAEKDIRAGKKTNVVGGMTVDPKNFQDMKEFEALLTEQKAKVKMALTEIENAGQQVIGSTETVTQRMFGIINVGESKTIGEVANLVNYVSVIEQEKVKNAEETAVQTVDLQKATNIELQKIANDAKHTQNKDAQKMLDARIKAEQEANEKSQKETEKLLEKKKRDLENYFEQVKRLNDEVAESQLEGGDREIYQTLQKYAKIIDEGKRLNQDIIQLEELKEKELQAIRDKYNKIRQDKIDEEAEKKKKREEEELERQRQQQLAKEQSVQAELARMQQAGQTELEQIDAKYAEMREKAGENKELLVQIEKARIDEVDAYEKQKKQEMASFVMDQAEVVFNGVAQIVNERRRQEQQEEMMAAQEESQREMANLDAKMQQELNRKNLSENQKKAIETRYQAAKDAAEENARNKERQLKLKAWEADKKASLISAAIAGALAVIRALPNWPNAIAAGIAAAVQIAIIAAQKPPKFEKGGIAQGAPHSRGGISMVDSGTGRKVGEMEGGEPYMILSRNTYRNNRHVVDSLLFNSMHRNGAPIDFPRFGMQPRLNFARVSAAARPMHFETGGIVGGEKSVSSSPAASGDQGGGATQEWMQEFRANLQMNTRAIMSLERRLSQPIKAVTLIGNEQAQDLDEVKSENAVIDGGGGF